MQYFTTIRMIRYKYYSLSMAISNWKNIPAMVRELHPILISIAFRQVKNLHHHTTANDMKFPSCA